MDILLCFRKNALAFRTGMKDTVREAEEQNRRTEAAPVALSLFRKKTGTKTPEPHKGTPAIRCSICTGEQVAGFRDKETGRFEEVMLLRTPEDLEAFRQKYGITGEIEKIY